MECESLEAEAPMRVAWDSDREGEPIQVREAFLSLGPHEFGVWIALHTFSNADLFSMDANAIGKELTLSRTRMVRILETLQTKRFVWIGQPAGMQIIRRATVRRPDTFLRVN